MRNLPIKALTVLCGVAVAGGCGSLKQTGPKPPAVAPVSKVAHSPSVADPNYQIGRALQGRRQYEPAIGAYRKSLEANPGNAEAYNALGVIYATLGKHESALTEFMAALAIAPSAVHIHNNLGYAYLMRGRSAEAVATLKVATELDPASPRVRENMRVAEATLAHETRPLDGPVSAPVESLSKSAAQDAIPDPSLPHLITVAPNVLELRHGIATALAPSTVLAPPRQGLVKLEVANGSGVAGLARRTASALQTRGYAITRLTNQIPYTQVTTEIQYRRGEESYAKDLNALLSQPAKLVESGQLSPSVGVRLVLGRDTGEHVTFSDTSPGGTALAGLEIASPKAR